MTSDVLSFLRKHTSDMINDVQMLVKAESPSTDRTLLEVASGLVQKMAEDIGMTTQIFPQEQAGPHIRATLPGTLSDRPILVLTHYDTVWPAGTLSHMPCQLESQILRGPGVFDMKTGLVQALWAIRAIKVLGLVHRPIIFLSTSDEEVGSISSRALIESEACKAATVLVFEASERGSLKTARKGTLLYYLQTYGKAAHAGLNPEQGVSAINELVDQLAIIRQWANPQLGTTINAGVIAGGTRPNVVAAEAAAWIDIRVSSQAETQRIVEKMAHLHPVNPLAQLAIQGGLNRPPLERTAAVARLFDTACQLARPLGMELSECAVGGASDGNFCTPLGIPVLDGLGAVGNGAHAAHEWVDTSVMPHRAALAAELLSQL